MSTDGEKPSGLAKAGQEAAAHVVDSGLGLAATLIAAPVVGPAAPAVGLAVSATTKALRSLVRSHVEERAASRLQAFESRVAYELESDGIVPEELSGDERFAEAVFQGYRRAMEAVDPAAIDPIARLTARLGRNGPGAFFRRCGRFLQDATADELDGLRWALTAGRVRTACERLRVGDGRRLWIGWSVIGAIAPRIGYGQAETTTDDGDVPRAVLVAYRSLDVHGLAVCRENDGSLPILMIEAETAVQLLEVLGPAADAAPIPRSPKPRRYREG